MTQTLLSNLRNTALFFVIAVGICLLVLGCENIDGNEKALINVLLIDAPGDFDEVWLEVTGVEILPAGTRGLDNADWVFIPYTPSNKMVKVSDLVGSQRLLLGRMEIRAGQVSQVRLVLGTNHYLVQGGQQFMLQTEPDINERLQVNLSLQAGAGFAWDVYIDVNLAKSIRRNQSGGYLFRPEVRAFSLANRAEIRGNVQPPATRPHIFAINGTDTLATLTTTNGEFRLRGLPPATYRIHIQPRMSHLDSVFSLTAAADSIYTLGNIPLTARPATVP
ncbi:putative lipoprotein [Lunatimonas lonarensis]|uniref:Putative lipoprotein n=1 Tax=Lunatimonas lonarensis TaxID=1232681 RepID=R7ZXY8_9BACT|nr:DUF4382 domain-containing protein [Lunatimonas lonarensis]EON78864.1 putative lipoprotein [Lunatimonas lonarensis]